ncbi:MAG TPA: FAD binding domain-containing protein [Xanthobacteraceae bacterium]|nr:FAD binding domain-containing protein [Xanthobacteraceae bacterium]
MKAAAFAYSRPEGIEEACAVLAGDDGARLIAGGQTLVPLMAMRLARPTRLVDIARIPTLAFLRDLGEAVAIGATTTQRTAERDPLVRAKLPLLARALPFVGHAATRARGTIGGSLANADPAAEIALVAVTLDSTLLCRDAGGEREIAAEDFFLGPMTTGLPPAGMLTAIRFPAWAGRVGTAFHEVSPRQGDFAFASAAAQVALNEDGTCARIAIGVGAATERPLRLTAAERALTGAPLEPETIRAAVGDALAGITPMADLHASAEYRRRVARSLAIRAVTEAGENAKKTDSAGWDRLRETHQSASQTTVGSAAEPSTLRINGETHRIDVEPRLTLLDCLRDKLGLTGAHAGCEHGVCGACTVLIDGAAVRSCLMFAVQADGRAITTIEGLTPAPGELSVLQDAFCETHGLQCGYCTPAMIVTGHALLAGNAAPTRDEIVEAISGNICRCTGYAQIVEAIALAAERLRGANRPLDPIGKG